MDAEGRRLAEGPPLHDEARLHTEIYRAREDVGAVVHTHAAASIALSLFPDRLLAISQDAVPFVGRLAYYDRADLVTTAEQGRALAACLGDARAALLRAHGLVTVGEDVAEATVSAVLLERAARIQALASALGAPGEMAAEDLESLGARFERDRRRRVEGIWSYLVRASARP